MTGNDPETAAGDAAAERGLPAPAVLAEDPTARRRAALAELARLAALAPAMAVLFDPEKAQAGISP